MVFVGIGFELVGLVAVGLWVSSFLEDKFRSQGLITVAVMMLCLVSWLVHLVFLMKKTMKSEQKP